ncbi:hypothetical protein GCM10027566_30570 [Arachidicoccus ginsenosidivorans]|uniref:RNA ligase domain-containing protein n=1 Tax=Arachidicoccus ginsenosidivorans TaxID=496057 RepID=A0A5B8VJ12_9BACT|nr:RNA ligase family protein [Arachidicoccus ginsenosidivorans]QEC70576.1 hypothetical protein FSB73_01520 [Arachidicoccus ginsenosidivorans]
MNLTIHKGSENYTAQIIALPSQVTIPGLDNLVQVTYLGNNCLVQKNYNPNAVYLFFPAGAVLDQQFLSNNNLFRHGQNNLDTSKKGFFEDSGRVKALKLRGVISTGFIMPVTSLSYLIDPSELKIGDSFTDINGKAICRKYLRPERGFSSGGKREPKFDIETLVDPKFAPEHTDTAQLLRNTGHLTPMSWVTITHKLHGTSIRVFHTQTKRKLSLAERLLKSLGLKVQDQEYSYIVGSRKVIKSRNFRSVNNYKFFMDDLWSQVARNNLEGKLYKGEAVYGEIVGTDYTGGVIQKGYSYGFPAPKLFIYRITQINGEGIEIDLSWHQLKQRALQLGLDIVPELYTGRLDHFLKLHDISFPVSDEGPDLQAALEDLFYNKLLDKPSTLDHLVIEEGFVLRQDTYPKVTAYKIKSRKFQLHETSLQDADTADMEEDN